MKISELGFKWWVLFLTDTRAIEHSVGFEDLPNVATMLEVMNELKTDEEFDFSCDVDDLRIMIISNDEYLEVMGDLMLD
jgi:hypothetical protein